MAESAFENHVFQTGEDVESAHDQSQKQGTGASQEEEAPLGKEGREEKAVEEQPLGKDIIFGVEDVPPWHYCFLLGLQHFMLMVGSMIGIPAILASLFCIPSDHSARGQLISTILVCSGIVTLLQSIIGVRLPIIQGGTVTFMVPTIAIMTTSFPSCNSYDFSNMTEEDINAVWKSRMREIQGDIIVASMFQLLVGYTGAVGLVLTWITPLTIVPTITLVGFSLIKPAAGMASGQWGVALLTCALLILFSQYLVNVGVPVPTFAGKKIYFTKIKLFSFFPVILAILVSWGVCGILTAAEVFPSNSSGRTDRNLILLEKSPWFFVPYPFQWGLPTVTVAGSCGMLAAALASIIESVGDYYACARLSGVRAPPKHAINRGIGTEGLGCIIAGLIGTGNGTTSYSQNVGAIRVTKVASRRVIQVAAIIMLVCGVFGKFGAFFGTLPIPVMGGVYLIMFSIITAVGLSNLQVVNLNSSRNLFVLGISLFFGLAIPEWISSNSELIQTGSLVLNNVITVLLRTQMFVGGILGLILDNTIPGTDEERGLIKWKEEVGLPAEEAWLPADEDDTGRESCYDLPFGMTFFKRTAWCSKVPISPTYKEEKLISKSS